MDSKEEIQEQQNQHHCNCDNNSKTEKMIKFALLLLALFLASYLAVYYILDQIRHSYYIPRTQLESIDKIIKEQDKMFDSMGTLPMYNEVTKDFNTPVEMYKNDAENAYKIIINLKDLNNNPENIKLDINKNSITIKGISQTNKKNTKKHYEFSQNIVFPEQIEKDKIKKEHKKNKYIITLPIDD